jgi:hypothetical protein
VLESCSPRMIRGWELALRTPGHRPFDECLQCEAVLAAREMLLMRGGLAGRVTKSCNALGVRLLCPERWAGAHPEARAHPECRWRPSAVLPVSSGALSNRYAMSH